MTIIYESEHFEVETDGDGYVYVEPQTESARSALLVAAKDVFSDAPEAEDEYVWHEDQMFGIVSMVDRAEAGLSGRFDITVTVHEHSVTVAAHPPGILRLDADGNTIREALDGITDTLEQIGFDGAI